MAALTLTYTLSHLNSPRAQQAVARSVFFGACSSLRNACVNLEQMSRTIRNIEERFPERAAMMRTSGKFAELDKKVNAAANKAAGVHAICEAHDIMLAVDFAAPLPGATTKEEAQKISDATGLAVADIVAKRAAAASKKYGAECEAEDFAAACFWSAADPAQDVLVKYDTVVRAVEKTTLYIIEWSTPDYQELALLKADDTMIADWDSAFPDERLPEDYDDEDVIAERERKAEVAALDAHAKQQASLQYLDAERAKVAKSAKRRIKKAEAQTMAEQLSAARG